MKSLSDRVVARLQADMQLPDLTGTRYNLLRLSGLWRHGQCVAGRGHGARSAEWR